MTDHASAAGDWRQGLHRLTARLREPVEALERLLRDVVAQGVTAIGAENGSVMVPEEDGRHLRFLVSHGPTAPKLGELRVPIEGSIAGYVLSTAQMVAVGDMLEEHRPSYAEQVGKQIGVLTRTYLAVPILLGGHCRGVATYVNRPGGNPPYEPFQPDEIARAQAFAAVEAVLLRHTDHLRQLTRVAETDFQAALVAIDPATPEQLADLAGAENPTEPWTRILQELEELTADDQALCADLITLVSRRSRQGTL